MCSMGRRLRFSREELAEAIASSMSWSEALRRLGYTSAGGNWKTLKKYAELWGISAEHFDADAARLAGLKRAQRRKCLDEIMVENSTYSRNHLKERLFAEGLKERRCETCGQDEIWRGRRMALILDHINGVPDDHRAENLQVLCPNCAATLETHCARKNRLAPMPRDCLRCGEAFFPRNREQRYCSRSCGQRYPRKGAPGVPRPETRKVERPPYEQLLREVEELGYRAVGRKYGVSDNAIRKWLREYERERAIGAGTGPDAIEIPTRTWPKRRRDREQT